MTDLGENQQKIFEGASLVAFGLGFELFFSFLAKVGVARYLGSTDFGFFSIGFSLVTVMGVISLVGLSEGVARTIPRASSKREEADTIFTALSVSLSIALLVLILVLFFAEPVILLTPHGQTLVRVLQISSLTIPLLVISRVAVGVGRGYEKAKIKVLIQNLLRPGTFFAAMAIVILLSISNIRATYIIPISYIPGAMFGLYYILKKSVGHLQSNSFTFRYELLVFSAPLMISGFMLQILNHFDTFILAGFESAAQIGVYNAVYPLSRLVTVFLASFGFIVLPILSSIDAESGNDEFESIYHFATKWIVVGAIPVVLLFSLLPREIIMAVYGPEYISGQNALVILTLGICSNTILGPNTNALIALGKSRAILRSTAFAAALNTGLNFALIPIFGIEGAAVATAVATITMTFLYSVKLYKIKGIVPMNRNVVILIFSATVAALTFSTGLSWFGISPVWTLMIFCFVFGPVYLGLVFATGTLSRTEVLELVSLVSERG